MAHIIDRITPTINRIFQNQELMRESHLRIDKAIESTSNNLTSSNIARRRIRVEQRITGEALSSLIDDIKVLAAEIEALRQTEIVLDEWDKNSIHHLEIVLATAAENADIAIDIKESMADTLTILFNLGHILQSGQELSSFLASIPERDILAALEGATRIREIRGLGEAD
jgi:hypothetical protein